jgi:hypothetical protein
MGVRNSHVEGKAAMFDSTTGRAFGPVFDSSTELDAFLAWFGEEPHAEGARIASYDDVRKLSATELDQVIEEWREAYAPDNERTPV